MYHYEMRSLPDTNFKPGYIVSCPNNKNHKYPSFADEARMLARKPFLPNKAKNLQLVIY